jgi:hypothetical protein
MKNSPQEIPFLLNEFLLNHIERSDFDRDLVLLGLFIPSKHSAAQRPFADNFSSRRASVEMDVQNPQLRQLD